MPSLPWKSKLKRLSQGFKKPESTDAHVDTLEPDLEAAAAKASIPVFALRHAPVVWLHEDESYWPGSPVEHLKHVTPLTFEGEELSVPAEVKGTPAMLSSENIEKQGGNVFLTFPNVRKDSHSRALTSPEGKPDENGRSSSTCYIVVVDKTQTFAQPGDSPDDIWEKECSGKQVYDVFYFYFFPFNLGNKVLFQNFGNHVGDWEHNMIRFVDGKPRWMHYSAHSDGRCWTWDVLEKTSDGMRPLNYVAGGSHANYPTSGTHAYSPVPIFGPKDHTSRGFLWDPLKNWIGVKANTWAQFEALPEECSSLSGYCTDIPSNDLLIMMRYEGRWGNSFSQLGREHAFATFAFWPRLKHKKEKPSKVKVSKDDDNDKESQDHSHNPVNKLIHKAESDVLAGEGSKIAASIQEGTIKSPSQQAASTSHHEATEGPPPDPAEQAATMVEEEQKKAGSSASLTLYQKLLLLVWAEGPTGPRDKSLGRRMVNRWTDGFLDKLVL